MGRQEGIDLLLHSVHHIVRGKGREDVHFGLVGGGTELECHEGAGSGARRRGLRDVHRPRSGCGTARDAEYRGRLREPGRRE